MGFYDILAIIYLPIWICYMAYVGYMAILDGMWI